MQHLMKEQAVDAAPDAPKPERCRVPELGHSRDSGAVEPLFHARADPVYVLQFEAKQDVRQLVVRDDDQPIRLLQVGADLAEEHVRRETDGTGHALTDLLTKRALDLERQCTRRRNLPFGPHEAARHLVDRQNLVDRQTGIDSLQNAVMIISVEPVIGLHRDHIGTNPTRLPKQGAGSNAAALGRIAGRYGARGVRQRLDDNDRLAAQDGRFLLFARRKESVEVEEQPLQGSKRRRIVHYMFYIRRWRVCIAPPIGRSRSTHRWFITARIRTTSSGMSQIKAGLRSLSKLAARPPERGARIDDREPRANPLQRVLDGNDLQPRIAAEIIFVEAGRGSRSSIRAPRS